MMILFAIAAQGMELRFTHYNVEVQTTLLLFSWSVNFVFDYNHRVRYSLAFALRVGQ